LKGTFKVYFTEMRLLCILACSFWFISSEASFEFVLSEASFEFVLSEASFEFVLSEPAY